MRLRLVAALNSTGTGVYAQFLADALIDLAAESDLELQIMHPPQAGPANPCLRQDLTDRLRRHRLIYSCETPVDWELHVTLPQVLNRYPPQPGVKRALIPFFETSRLTPAQVAGLRAADVVLPPSGWAAAVMHKHQVTAHAVVPGGRRTLVDLPDTRRENYFVHVGKWEMRKGCYDLLRILPQMKREILLHAFWSNPWDPGGAERALFDAGYARVPDIDRIYQKDDVIIVLRSPLPTVAVVQNVMAAAHAAVYPHRGEGWGLPVLDSMLLGVPTVSSSWTAPMEYVFDYDALLIKAFGNGKDLSLLAASYEPADDGVFFKSDEHGSWFVPNDEEIKDRLERALSLPLDSPQLRDIGQRLAAQRSWGDVAKDILREIS